MSDFLLHALGAGVLLALVCGPLGCFIVWRRMAYFGDTLAHSALLGIALGILLQINLQLSVAILCCLLAILLVVMEKRGTLATDTILGILAHGALALGIVALSLTDTRIDLFAFLFGDLLAVSSKDLLWMFTGGAMAIGILLRFWNRLLVLTLNQEMAQVEGANVLQLRLLLMLVMAMVVAGAMKIVGVLLITSLLIIPPAAARNLAVSPEQMVLGASLLGTLAVLTGIGASWFWDTPTGPSIVVAAAGIFVVCSLRNRQAAP
jgi:zinc transport system permease protein